MNCTLSSIIAFSVGAAVGAVVATKLLKSKYEKIAQEEIEAVREVYFKDYEEKCEQKSVEDNSKENSNDLREEMLRNCEAIIESQGYAGEKEEMSMIKPYVIEPVEFGELHGYDTVTLTYYADGVLTDDMDEPIEDVDGMVGKDSLNHFGEYEDDSVYVRNEKDQTDYEILYDSRNYDDVINERNPYDPEA